MTNQRILVVYYSRTGTTREVAETLSQALGCDTEEIVESRSRIGILGYLRSIVDARREHAAAVATAKYDPSFYDLVIVGTPIWAWSVSSPIRAYLMTMKAKLPDVAFFCTCGGAGSARAFAQMREIIGKIPRAQCVIVTQEMSSGQYRERVTAFVKALDVP